MTTSSRPLSVALLTWSVPGGGIGAFFLRLGGYLRARGVEVTLVTTEAPGAWFSRFPSAGIPAMHLPGWLTSCPLADARRIARHVREAAYDVVLLNNAKSAQLALNDLPDTTVAIPVIHGTDAFSINTPCRNAERWNVAVAVSPGVRELALRRAPGRPVQVIPHGVPMPDAAAWARRPAMDSPVRLAFVGRVLDAEKGVFFLPPLLQALSARGIEATLTVAGDGPDRAPLLRRCRDLGVDGQVRLPGFVSPEEAAAVMLDAHVLVLPSRREGFGLVLAEAQACGCVPVASRLPGVTDLIVDEGRTGFLVEVGDVGAMAGAIARLTAEPEAWARMSGDAHAYARAHHSLDAMGDAYLQLITEAVGGRYPLPRPRAARRGPLDGITWRDLLPNGARALARALRPHHRG